MLLIKPNPEPGESWPGYLLRVATLNHLDRGLAHLARLIGVNPLALIANEPDVVLCKLGIASSGASTGEEIALTGASRALRASRRATAARICPDCIREMTNKHVLAAWDQALQIQCRRHRTFLIDTCPSCSQPISHRRMKLLGCDCGADLLGASSKKLHVEFDTMYEVLGLQPIYFSGVQTFAASTQAEATAAALCRRLLLLNGAVELGMQTVATSQRPEVFLSVQELMKVREVLDQWPENFFRLLDTYRSMFGQSPVPRLIGGELRNKDLPVQVRTSLNHWVSNASRSLRPGKRIPSLVQKGEQETVGIKYLIRATGCSYDTAMYWIESGKLGPYKAVRQPSGLLRFDLDKQRVQKAIQISRASSSVCEMATNLGTTGEVLRLFVRAKALFAVPFGRAPYNFRLHPPEVYALAQRILGCARFRSDLSEEQLVFSSAIKRFRKRPPNETRLFLDALFNGVIPLTKVQRHVTALDELLVDLAALKRWRKGRML